MSKFSLRKPALIPRLMCASLWKPWITYLLGVVTTYVLLAQFKGASLPVIPPVPSFSRPVSRPPPPPLPSAPARETCAQWLRVQNESGAHLDAYVVGSQKGATSELTKRLHKLGVRREGMVKEWHCFNQLDIHGGRTKNVTTHLPFVSEDVSRLRFVHYKTGFPDDGAAAPGRVPAVDVRGVKEREVVYDSTVEYLHTDRAAYLAHLVSPHAKIIVTMRDPIERAISQYNMFNRGENRKRSLNGEKSLPATPDAFDEVVRQEIDAIRACGYDEETASLRVGHSSSRVIECMFSKLPPIARVLMVFRGLYPVHVDTWRDYFPDHRILYLSFSDLTVGKREAYNQLTRFLCVRDFPNELLAEFEREGSAESYGLQAAQRGLEQAGSGDVLTGDDAYMTEIKDSTRRLLNDFYASSTARLAGLMQRDMY